MGPFTALEMNLSDRCNLACSFCYTRGGGGQGPDFDRVVETLAWLFGQPGLDKLPQSPRFNITLYGGEPLVEWKDLTQLVELLIDEKKPVKFGIVTNMTLLDEQKLYWLLAHNVSISPSIDGCPQAQNTFRKFEDGTGTAEAVTKAARLLLRLCPNQSVRMTVAPETVQYLSESVRFLWGLGFKQINPVLAGGVEWPESLFTLFTEEIRKVTNWWIGQVHEGKWPSIFYLRNVATVIEERRMNSLCAAGVNRVAIDTMGWATPCHRFANPSAHPEWRLGNILTDSYESILNSPIRAAIQNFRREYRPGQFPQCLSCGMRSFCYVWCFHEAMVDGRATLKDGKLSMEPAPFFCRTWDLYYQETLRALQLLAAVGNGKAKGILAGKIISMKEPQ